jgi:cytochrome P450
MLVFMAGHETTMALIANGIHLIWSRPEVLRSLRQEPSLMAQAVDEVMRFDPPILRMGRRIGEDMLWNDCHAFKKGQFVQLLLGAANRDEREFERADEFSIHREKNPHLGFGGGAHYCVGAQLARLEATLALTGLLERFPKMALVDREAPYFSTLTLRCRTSVPVTLE